MTAITYYGVSFFRIITERGVKIWIDPYVTQNKHCPIKLDEVVDADIVLVSHSAYDHIGPRRDGSYDAFEIVKKTGATLVAPDNVGVMAKGSGIPAERITCIGMFGGEASLKGIRIKGIEAHHGGPRFAKTDGSFSRGELPDPGGVNGCDQGYLLTLENDVRIYHSGDTCAFPDLRYVGEAYRPNILMFDSGSPDPKKHALHTNPFEVATIVRWIGPDVFIPMHDAFNVLTEKVTEFVNVAAPHVRVAVMKPGDTIRYRPFQLEKL
jgi:L-ascorbate metabolism protein UlaG (beta-lactamase superfamily)